MQNLILFVLSTIGMTNIIVDGKIFNWPRNEFEKLDQKYQEAELKQKSDIVKIFLLFIASKIHNIINCHQCCGFWVGVLAGLNWISLDIFDIFLCGCAGSFASSFVYLLIEYIVSKTEIVITNE